MPRLRIHVTGVVEGVGFRPFVWRAATARDLSGWVRNAPDGVHLEAEGTAEKLDSLVSALSHEAPAAARVNSVTCEDVAERNEEPPFRIVASTGVGDDRAAASTLVSPDIATCPECVAELFDPANRRYHYPFINCTSCGPRFTIIRELPYDRPRTSMAGFPMCPVCASEYADPANRRFHAQPDACFDCGPHLTWRTHDGSLPAGDTLERSDAIVAAAAALICAGGIVAVKGLGGFHLACDATSEEAVTELRRRKHRPDKPFAVMVPTLDAALNLAQVSPAERDVLTGTVRPIVLLRRRRDEGATRLAPSVAGDLPELGVMLPYTPLQHLLLAACDRPLVMTSGNTADEPIEVDDERAWERLGGIAYALLGNDRPILSRYDDSVVRVDEGGAVIPVRRARGIAPAPVALPPLVAAVPPATAPSVAVPRILACGPEQKATLAISRDDLAFVSQHVGDVDDALALSAWHEARRRYEEVFGLGWDAVAVDLHPGYLTSAWGRDEARRRDIPLVEVQHHHAHIASVLGEHGSCGPVLGVAFDGTGAGTDGTVWGGEVLLVTASSSQRLAHLGRWRLPGGSAAVRDPRRAAVGLVVGCGLEDHPGCAGLRRSLGDERFSAVASLARSGVASPVTSSAGRLFDAVAAIAGVCAETSYEGQAACELEAALVDDGASDGTTPYPVGLVPDRETGLPSLALAPLVSAVLDDICAGAPTRKVSVSFHEAMARTVVALCEDGRTRTGISTVALSGGVFANRTLLARARQLLGAAGFEAWLPQELPVNDGCIAYGQLVVARAVLAETQ